MCFGRIALIGSLVFAFSANAQDVMVNLDVLNDLDNPYAESSKPLFPVFTPTVQTKVKKEVPTLSKKLRKRKSVKKKSVNKADASKPDYTIKKEPKPISLDEIKPLGADVIVVDKEPVSAPIPVKSETESVVVVDKEPVSAPAPVEPKVEPLTIDEDVVNPKPEIAKNEEDVTSEKNNQVGSLIIEEAKPIVETGSYIKFAEGEDYLNDEQKVNVDKIVSTYQNGPKNKIAIYSYNLDDGVDSFKKKRISLNRAVEVRSYLLKKGYKNFSIKVININTVSEKTNSIELKEI